MAAEGRKREGRRHDGLNSTVVTTGGRAGEKIMANNYEVMVTWAG